MKLTHLSVRTMVFRICFSAALTVLVLLLATYVVTKSSAAVICVLVTSLAMSLFGAMMMQFFQKKLAVFTTEICATLDEMIDGTAQLKQNMEEETLFARISHQLEKLYLVMKHQKASVERERAELQELISDISHQTKTPITNLKMIHDTLLQETPTQEALTEFLQAALTQVDKLDFLVEAMVKTSRLETGVIVLKKSLANLYETLAAAIGGIFTGAREKHMEITVDCPETLMLSHDSKWTAEALFNILDNAVKYTPAGGNITVKAERLEAHTKIKIEDSGKGISESRQAEIFKRFYREEEVHDEPGIGIGLYLAREIITLQGGFIQVASAVGAGATFSVFLPNH